MDLFNFWFIETGSHGAQGSLEVTPAWSGLEQLIFLPLPPECWDYRYTPPHTSLCDAGDGNSHNLSPLDWKMTQTVVSKLALAQHLPSQSPT